MFPETFLKRKRSETIYLSVMVAYGYLLSVSVRSF